MAPDTNAIARLFIPLLLIPLTLYAVRSFGTDAGNAIIGLAFLAGIVKFADVKERRLLVTLTILAALFETANVASGAYKYAGTGLPPLWICIGWGVVGLYLMKNRQTFAMVPAQAAYAAAAVFYPVAWYFTGAVPSMLVASLFAIASVYVLSLASRQLQPAFFLFAGLAGVLIEFCGTSLGIWTYFDQSGAVIPVNTGSIGLAYAAVVAFGTWLAGCD